MEVTNSYLANTGDKYSRWMELGGRLWTHGSSSSFSWSESAASSSTHNFTSPLVQIFRESVWICAHERSNGQCSSQRTCMVPPNLSARVPFKSECQKRIRKKMQPPIILKSLTKVPLISLSLLFYLPTCYSVSFVSTKSLGCFCLSLSFVSSFLHLPRTLLGVKLNDASSN